MKKKLSHNALRLLNYMKKGNGITEFMLKEKDKWIQDALDELKPTKLIVHVRPLGWFYKDD